MQSRCRALVVPVLKFGNIFVIGTEALSDGGTPTMAVRNTRSIVQVRSAPGTDILVCHRFQAMPKRLSKIDLVPFYELLKEFVSSCLQKSCKQQGLTT